jgi:hypothetical protein
VRSILKLCSAPLPSVGLRRLLRASMILWVARTPCITRTRRPSPSRGDESIVAARSNAIEDPCTSMRAKTEDSILHVVQQCQRLLVSTRPLLHASSIPLLDDESTDNGEDGVCSSAAFFPLSSHVPRAPAHLDLDYDLDGNARLRHWPRDSEQS